MFRFSLPLPPEPHSFLLTEQSVGPFSRENMVVLFHIIPVLSLLSLSWSRLFFPPVFSVHLLRLVIAKHFVSTSDFAILAIPSPFRLHVFALCQTARSSRSYIRLRRHVDKKNSLHAWEEGRVVTLKRMEATSPKQKKKERSRECERKGTIDERTWIEWWKKESSLLLKMTYQWYHCKFTHMKTQEFQIR